MSERKKEKEYRYFMPVEKIPPGPMRIGVYDDILKEFMDSGLKYAEVKDMGRRPETVTQSLKTRIKNRRIENIVVIVRGKKVYLERLERPKA